MRGIHGSWLIPGDGSPAVAGGGVVLDERERVVAVGEGAALRRAHPSVRFEALSAVLMPGLVNAHTHLELSALRGLVAGGHGFVRWVDGMMSIRAVRQPEADAESIEQGVSELLAAGVVAIGEVSNRLATVPVLAALPIAGCIFHEVFGLRRDTGEVTLGMAREERAAFGPWPAQWKYSLAPHTPYTLHPETLREILALARASGGRTSLHLAEHAAERAFLEHGGGPFPEWLKTRAASEVDWPPPQCDPVRYAEQLGALGPDVIAVHLTDARPDELALVAKAGSPVVLCPRSNLHIELKLPPLLDVLRTGLRPGLGTDSLASNASLDPLAEARALRQRFPTVPPATLLAMTTGWGADALGYGGKLGRIEVGSYPGVLAFEHGSVAPAEPERFILDNDRALRRVVSRPNYPALPAEVFA
jgi:cytosine/adenosine deaminase-related metal-dependent hydrolase